MPCYAYQAILPVVDPTSIVHPPASLIGVTILMGMNAAPLPGARSNRARQRSETAAVHLHGPATAEQRRAAQLKGVRD